MFRQVAVRFTQTAKSTLTFGHLSKTLVASQMRHASAKTNEAFDNDWVDYFNKEDLDDWGLRRGLNELYGFDLVPEPKIVSAALKACRRLNDSAMAVRILESIKAKSCVDKTIYPFILQEVRPTLDELGISTPEELGLDIPDPEKQKVSYGANSREAEAPSNLIQQLQQHSWKKHLASSFPFVCLCKKANAHLFVVSDDI